MRGKEDEVKEKEQNMKPLVLTLDLFALIASQRSREQETQALGVKYKSYSTTERSRRRFGSSKALIQGYLILCN